MGLFIRNKESKRSDHGLIKDYVEDGNQNAVATLYDRYIHMVYGLCLRYLEDADLAKDACMDIYLLLAKKLKTHEPHSFKNWLYTLSKNHCLGLLRSESAKRIKKTDAELMYTEQIFHPDDVRDEKTLTLLKKCIELLPEKQRDCIVRFYYKKESYQQISEQQNMAWNKIRSYIQNGRRNLKNCISSKK